MSAPRSTEIVPLTSAERADLWKHYTMWEEGDDFGEHMGGWVERLLAKRQAAERERIADFLLTYSADGEPSDWQAGHNYAMREASRMVREGWTDLGSALTEPRTTSDEERS